jgi:hypothetical protein
MKSKTNLVIILMTSLFVIGCVQVPQEEVRTKTKLAISSVRDIPVAYPQGSVFSLAPEYVKKTSLKPQQTQAVYQLYSNAIINDLSEHNFTNNPNSSSADFHVGFGIALANDLSDKTINEKFGVTPGLPESNGLEKGSFLIYIQDSKTGKTVWRGAAQGFVHEELNEEQRKQRASDIVANVMKQFYATN